MKTEQAFGAMKKAADGYADGYLGGDDLHSAVVDYTDAVAMSPARTGPAYPAWMDLTESASNRRDFWEDAGHPVHGFTPALPDSTLCAYCSRPPGSYAAHNVQAQAAAYAPSPGQLAALIGRGTASLAGTDTLASLSELWKAGDLTIGEYERRRAALLPGASLGERIAGLPGLAEQVHGIRLDDDTVAIAGATYIRRPF